MCGRLFQRMVTHTTTLGYDPQANGLAERVVGLIKEQTRRLLQAETFPEAGWTWATGHVTDCARAQIMYPKGTLIPFGARVAIRKHT